MKIFRGIHHRAIVSSLFALLSLGCTTATISNNLLVEPYAIPVEDPSQTPRAYTIGGKGADWGSIVLCRSSQAACMYFGFTIKSFGESTDLLAVKLAPAAQPIWARTYGGTHKERLLAAIATRDNGYVLLGESQSMFNTPLRAMSTSYPSPRPLLMKISETGELQWARIIPHEAQALYEARDGSLLVVGRKHVRQQGQADKVDINVMNIGSDGKFKWSRTYDTGINSYGSGIAQARDGSLIIAGTMQAPGADFDAFLLALTEDGGPLWAKRYEQKGYQGLDSLIETADHGWIASGPDSQGVNIDSILAMKVAPRGDIVWSRTYSSSGYSDKPTAMIAGYENTFLVVGRSDNLMREGRSEKETKGAALLLNEVGTIVTSAHIGRSAALMSAARTGDGEYALLGSYGSPETQTPKMFATFWKPAAKGQQAALFSHAQAALRTLTIDGIKVHDESIEDTFIQNVDIQELQLGREQAPMSNTSKK